MKILNVLLCLCLAFSIILSVSCDVATDVTGGGTTASEATDESTDGATVADTTGGEADKTTESTSTESDPTGSEEAEADGVSDETTAPATEPLPEIGDGIGQLCPVRELYSYSSGSETFSILETRGRITLLNFWATWCEPCVWELDEEFPRVTEAYGEKVAIVAVHVSIVNRDVQAYVDTYFSDLDVIFCQDENNAYYLETGGNAYVPYTVVLDENGVILHRIVGATSLEELRGIIDPALAD